MCHVGIINNIAVKHAMNIKSENAKTIVKIIHVVQMATALKKNVVILKMCVRVTATTYVDVVITQTARTRLNAASINPLGLAALATKKST
jgi:hypothetical protein